MFVIGSIKIYNFYVIFVYFSADITNEGLISSFLDLAKLSKHTSCLKLVNIELYGIYFFKKIEEFNTKLH